MKVFWPVAEISLLSAALFLTSVSESPAFDLAAVHYPLAVLNCGKSVSFAEAPHRVLVLKSSATTTLVDLGLTASIAAVANQDEPPSAALPLPVLADKLPTREAVLALHPDLIYSGWESAFDDHGLGSREFYEDLGIKTLVAPMGCRSHPLASETFGDVFSQIELIGSIFDRSAAAGKLVDTQQLALAKIDQDSRQLKAFWYSSGTRIPYAGAGNGVPQAMMDALGLKNVFADVAADWASVSWESVALANPDVIVLVDASWNSADQKRAILQSIPAVSGLEAVRLQRYIVVPFVATEAGVRTVPELAHMQRQLASIAK